MSLVYKWTLRVRFSSKPCLCVFLKTVENITAHMEIEWVLSGLSPEGHRERKRVGGREGGREEVLIMLLTPLVMYLHV